jgi:estrone sulfotransferase
MTTMIRRLRYHLLGLVSLSKSDVLLTSYPRSGSTWIRFLLCNLLSLIELDGATVDFPLLNQTMIELGANNLLRPWPYAAIPRIIKTHRPYCPVFRRAGSVIGVVRHPRDVMVSSFHYMRDRQRSYHGDFAGFVRNRHYGLDAWFRHTASWRKHWDLVISYEKVRADTAGEFGRILDFLDVNCPQTMVSEAIRRSSIRSIQSVEGASLGLQPQDARFVRDGGVEQWPAYFSAADLAYYDSLVQKYRMKGSAEAML